MAQSTSLIIFSGLKHSGKSTMARLFAQRLGLPAADLDQLIAELAAAEIPGLGSPAEPAACVRKLYREQGREVFQTYEARAAGLACHLTAGAAGTAPPPRLLALGGGTMENPAAMAELRHNGFIVFFDVPRDILFERIMRGGLPAFLDPADPRGSFRLLYDRRRSLGADQADLVIALNDKTIEQAYSELLPHLKEYIHGR